MELWFTEKHTSGAGITLRCNRTIFSAMSDIQRIDVLETEDFGRMLLLDGLVMTTERDEFIYHEMLVHPSMNLGAMPPCKALVIGGGDGGTVRELVKYPCLEEVVLCEIDPMVVEVSKKYLPGLSSAMSSDPRVELVFEDGKLYASRKREEFDRIFVDSSDPVGAAEVLFTPKFYKMCFDALKAQGILVVQSESPIYHMPIIKRIKEGLCQAGFRWVRFYTAPVPTYPGGYWSWAMAVKDECPVPGAPFLPEEEAERLKFFTMEMLSSCFVLPAFMKREVG